MSNNSTKSGDLGTTERMERTMHDRPDEVPGDEIDLRGLFCTLWEGKWFILSVTAMSALMAVGVALWLPNEYKAVVVLTPASASSNSSLARLAGQFGNLASLAGISLGGQNENDKTVMAMELVKSWGFQEQFIRDNHLEVDLFAATGWHRATNRLVIDPDIYDVRQSKWVRKFKPEDGQRVEPSGWELHEELSDRLAIAQDKKTSLITLSVEYYSPYFAKDWVDKLVVAINSHIQEQDRREASKGVQYLQEKMSQTTLMEMKTVFSRLIEEQTKNLMLTDISDEYVFKTLSPAKVPEEVSAPNRIMICIAATLGGGILSVLGWLLWSMSRVRREPLVS